MAKHWVINASPIISLTKIDRIDLLNKLCDEVIIPQGVADEIKLGGHNDIATTWLQQVGHALVKPVTTIHPEIASWDLGLGESHVLSWAIANPGDEAIIDDLAARKAANIFHIPVRGTIAVVVLAKRMGYISSVKQDLERLVQVGLRISPALMAQAIALAEET